MQMGVSAMKKICSTKRIYSFSYLRVAACLAIILLHTVFAANVFFADTLTESQNVISRMIENCMMWAVPSFLMITGALLLDLQKKITFRKLFRRYILRMLLVLLLFCMIFRVFDMIMDGEEITIVSFLRGFYEFFVGKSWGHLWYLYLLIGLYLLLPFYKKIVKYSTDRELQYLVVVYTGFLSLLPMLNIWDINCGFYICTSLIYPLYLFCGYMIHEKILKINGMAALLLVVVSTVLIIGLTKVRWETNFEAMDELWGYSSILVVAQTVGIFALADRWHIAGTGRVHRIVMKLDECSFGVYLIHMIFVRLILRYMEFNPYENGGILMFAALIVGNFIVSFCITWVLKKLPGFRRIL